MSTTGREPSFDDLARRYSRVIRSAVGKVAGPLAPAIADDVEQEVLLALWRAMPGEQTPASPSSYLYRAAVRETVRLLRRRRDMFAVELEETADDRGSAPDRLAESRELARTMGAALRELPAKRRRAVEAHLMGFAVGEIMTMQSWSYNTARNLIARGMADLRRELRRRGVDV